MKNFFFLIVVLAVHTIFAQNQPVTVLSQKWSQKVDMRIINENNPFNASNSDITFGTNTTINRENVGRVGTNKYFAYEAAIKNDSDKKIIGLAWDYVFYDNTGKVEKARKKFNFTQTIKKDKKETLVGTTNNPHDLVLNAKDYENKTIKPQEAVEVNCVIFEDQTTWKRTGIDEKICEDLRIKIKNREKRLN
jgi:hypothetical protein